MMYYRKLYLLILTQKHFSTENHDSLYIQQLYKAKKKLYSMKYIDFKQTQSTYFNIFGKLFILNT